MSPTRRSILGNGVALGTALLLTGCGGGNKTAPPTPTSTPRSPSLIQASSAERTLLGMYAAVLARHPQLGPVLAVPLDQHRQHARALDTPPTATIRGAQVPSDPREAVRTLIALERTTSTERVTHAVDDILNGSLLAALAAAEAVHVDLLTAALPTVPEPEPTSSTSTTPTRPAPRPTTTSSTHSRSSTPPTHPPAPKNSSARPTTTTTSPEPGSTAPTGTPSSSVPTSTPPTSP